MSDIFDPQKYLQAQWQHLKTDYKALSQCNRCGFCETVCPTYVVSGRETFSPRGRNQALRQILEGKIESPVIAQEVFSTCLTCHACTNVCYSQVPVGRLMAQAKQIVLQTHPLKYKIQGLFLSVLLTHRFLFRLLLYPAFIVKRMGLVSLFLRLKWFNNSFLSSADALLPKPSLALDRPVEYDAGACQKPSVSYFTGCGMLIAYPTNARTSSKILQSCSGKIKCTAKVCCGMIASSAGNLDQAKILAKKLIDQLHQENADYIVVNDASCAGFMRSYPNLLQPEADVQKISSRVKTMSEYLQLQDARWQNKNKIKVTWHDACQIGNGQKSFESARALLRQIPNVEYVEMDESNWCCGGAGTYCLKHPHLADAILERKIQNIVNSGAQFVVAEAASCLMHVEYGLQQKGLSGRIKVMHLSDFLNHLNNNSLYI